MPQRGETTDLSEKYSNVLKQYILSNKEIVDELLNDSKNQSLKRVATSPSFEPYLNRIEKKDPKLLLNQKIDRHIKKKQLILEKLMLDRAHAVRTFHNEL